MDGKAVDVWPREAAPASKLRSSVLGHQSRTVISKSGRHIIIVSVFLWGPTGMDYSLVPDGRSRF